MAPIALELIKMAVVQGISSLSGSSEKENEEIAEKIIKKVIPIEAQKALEKVVDIRPFWKTKTFWTMSIGVLVPILNRVFGWDMDVSEVSATISPLLLFIATEQWKKKG